MTVKIIEYWIKYNMRSKVRSGAALHIIVPDAQIINATRILNNTILCFGNKSLLINAKADIPKKKYRPNVDWEPSETSIASNGVKATTSMVNNILFFFHISMHILTFY